MLIYKPTDYGTDEVILNKPCDIKGVGLAYPILVKDYKSFLKCGYIFPYNYKHLGINNSKELLNTIIMSFASVKDVGIDNNIEALKGILKDLEDAFFMVFRRRFKYRIINNEFEFYDIDGEGVISKDNYNIVRTVILKQNTIEEPKIYNDPEVQEWVNRYHASKKNSITFGDIIVSVSCATGKKYSELEEQNMLQLLSDYNRISHVENFKSSIIFKTVDSKVPNIQYITPIIDEIYKDKSEDMFTSLEELGKHI